MTASDTMNVPPAVFPRVLRQAGAVLLLALIPALLAAAFHPRRPAWSRDHALVPEVTWATVRDWPGLVLLVDARNAAAYQRQHIPGALSLSERGWRGCCRPWSRRGGPAVGWWRIATIKVAKRVSPWPAGCGASWASMMCSC